MRRSTVCLDHANLCYNVSMSNHESVKNSSAVAMWLRGALAVMDHNFNVKRKQRTDRNGSPMFRKKVSYRIAGL